MGSYDAPEVACLSGERDGIVDKKYYNPFLLETKKLNGYTVFQQGRSALRGSPAKQRMCRRLSDCMHTINTAGKECPARLPGEECPARFP